jgi:hypothetical protein
VSTTDRHAPVRVDALAPGTLVPSFDRDGGAVIRRRVGYAAAVASRKARSLIVNVQTVDGHRVAATPGHRMIARWNARSGVAVYMMRSFDDLWRVGTAQLHPDAQGYQFGPARRATDEGARDLWVLDVLGSDREARGVERFVSDEFGITQQCLHRYRRAPDVDTPRPADALRAYGRSVTRPLWRSGERKGRGCRASMDLAASNLLPGWMDVPTDDGSPRPRWLGFTVEPDAYDGALFALTVEKLGHYVADGIIVRDSAP